MNSIRFSFIEAMINAHGSIKRCHLCRAFGVTEPTATRSKKIKLTHWNKESSNGVKFA